MDKFNEPWSGNRSEKRDEAKSAAMRAWQERQQMRNQQRPAAPARDSKQSDVSAAAVSAVVQASVSVPPVEQHGIILHKSGGEALIPCQALRRLTSIYLDGAATHSPNVVLMWPGALRNLSLAHVFATAAHWAVGNKAGLRSMRYPVKSNTFYPLNHIQFGNETFLRLAQDLVENPGTPNPRVIKSLPEKDPVYFRIANTRDERACINEVLPHFERLGNEQQWDDYSEELLEHLLTKVRRRIEKAALREQLSVIGSPQTAPDATFSLGYRLSKSEINAALKSMKRIGTPNIVLLDATRNVRISVEGWRGRILTFLSVFYEVFKDNAPGLVAVTDEPRIAAFLYDEIPKRSKPVLGREARPKYLPIACTRHDDGLIPKDVEEDLLVEPRRFKVLIKDSEASKVIGTLARIGQSVTNPGAAESVRSAVTYLLKFSALPSSTEMLLQWLDERQADARFRDQFLWAAHRASLQQLATSGAIGEQRQALEKAIAAANKLIADYNAGTAIAHALAHEIEAAATSSKHIAVVFTRPMLKTLAEKYLATYEYSNGHRMADFQQRIRLILTKDLGGPLDADWAGRYVFVGVDDEALRFLVADNRVSNDSRLLLTYRAGLYLRAALRPLHTIEEFKRFRPRIDGLLEQLNEQLGVDERSILPSDDFLMPSFNFSKASSTTEAADDDDPEAWRIELEDGQVLRRSETSPVYVYEPSNERAGEAGFHAVEAKSLAEGALVFVMSEDLKELLEDHLRQAGMTVSRDKPFESNLRQYHELVMRKLSERFPLPSSTKQVEAIREHIHEHHPEIKDLPANIRTWIHLGESANTPFEDLVPQAPRKYAHFKAFAEALGFDATQVMWYWQSAIYPIRVNRRVDGRYISDIYSKILFDAESAIVHGGLSRKVTNELYEKARENVYSVVSIYPPYNGGE